MHYRRRVRSLGPCMLLFYRAGGSRVAAVVKTSERTDGIRTTVSASLDRLYNTCTYSWYTPTRYRKILDDYGASLAECSGRSPPPPPPPSPSSYGYTTSCNTDLISNRLNPTQPPLQVPLPQSPPPAPPNYFGLFRLVRRRETASYRRPSNSRSRRPIGFYGLLVVRHNNNNNINTNKRI